MGYFGGHFKIFWALMGILGARGRVLNLFSGLLMFSIVFFSILTFDFGIILTFLGPYGLFLGSG